MKKVILMVLFVTRLSIILIGQPVTNSGSIFALDLDGNGTVDIAYNSSAHKMSELPEDWQAGFGIEPWGSSRLVRATTTRLQFFQSETINSSRRSLTNYFPDPPRPPGESYGVSLLFYRAVLLGEWQYSTLEAAYEGESDLIFGLRLSLTTGVHYGWLRLSRPTVDNHTAFDLVNYAVHRVPGEPILAGQPPPLPPIQTQVAPEGLTFSWDARWGPLVLESTTNLVPPISWDTVTEGAGGPVDVSNGEEQRFYRLRAP